MYKVIIAEDEEKIALLHKSFLDDNPNFEVLAIANTIKETQKALEILNPDLILLDVYFPDGNGIELLKWIRQNNLLCDVILITAARETHALEQALKFGIYDYLVKPILLNRLEVSLRNYVNYKNNLNNSKIVSQDYIDNIIGKKNNLDNAVKNMDNLPKGIDKLTLEKIIDKMKTIDTFLSASELGDILGINRTTARRYLEYLSAVGLVNVDSQYGTIGRPEKRYKLI
ncbi:MAG: transcriptional regulatory protein CitB, DpiA [Deferribacteraceae bacterium]|jgi:response regulator of citrate/malate metabolism|nr:transcriptional regulatory protein CitB, DpiA [Deferribacteraceae bacterium]